MDSLPEGLRSSDTFAKFIDPETKDLSVSRLAESYQHLQSAAGWPADQIVRLPKADDAKGLSDLYGRLGRPETPEAYAFNGIDLKNEGDKAFVEGFRADAHAAGMTQSQMDVMMGYLGKSMATVDADIERQIAAQREAATAELRTTWGDKYDILRNDIPASVEWLGVKAGLIDPKSPDAATQRDNLVKALNVGGEADNPTLMRLFGVFADLRAEGGSLPGQGKAVQQGSMTVAEAQAAKTAFLAKAENVDALHDAFHANHKLAIAERDRLNAIISQGGAVGA